MGAALSDQQLKAIEDQLNSNPRLLQTLQQTMAQYKANYRSPRTMPSAEYVQSHPSSPSKAFESVGINFPDAEDYRLVQSPDGTVHFQRDNWFQRNADWVVPIATIGGGAAIGALAGGGSAVPAATAPAATTGTTAGTVGTTAGVVAPAVTKPILDATVTTPNSNTGFDNITDGANTSNDFGLTGNSNIPPGSNAGTPKGGGGIDTSGIPPAQSYEDILKQLLNNQNKSSSDLLGLLTSVGGGIASALAGSLMQQKRQSFKGTAADPVNTLSAINAAIGNEGNRIDLQGVQQQARQDANANLDVPSLPTFVGGGLPMPIGVRRNTNTSSALSRSLYDEPPSQDELDHLYSNLSIVGGKR